jgi:virginiamycin B lyase
MGECRKSSWWGRFAAASESASATNRPARVLRPGGPDTGLEDRKLMTLQVSTFSTPAVALTSQALTKGSDGNLWFTEPGVGKIGVMTPSGGVIEQALPSGQQANQGITAAPDGNVWFTETNKVVRVTPGGAMTSFNVSPTSQLTGITAGADGNIWFMDTNNSTGSKIGRITPSGVVTEFPIPQAQNMQSQGLVNFYQNITAGPNGNIWYTAERVNTTTGIKAGVIGQVSPSGGVQVYNLPAAPRNSNPRSTGSGGLLSVAITAGPDGNVWFTSFQAGGHAAIGKITPSGRITQYALPSIKPVGAKYSDISTSITSGPDGNLWFNLEQSDFVNGPMPDMYVGRISPTGKMRIFPMPVVKTPIQDGYASEGAETIIAGPNNQLWFTGSSRRYLITSGRVIASITPPAPR